MLGLVGARRKSPRSKPKVGCSLVNPPNLKRGELRLRDWRRYLGMYHQLLKQVEDWRDSPSPAHCTMIVLEETCGRRRKKAGKEAHGSTHYVAGRSASSHHGILPAKPGIAEPNDSPEAFGLRNKDVPFRPDCSSGFTNISDVCLIVVVLDRYINFPYWRVSL